jgi:hypothetical protein
LNFNSNLLNSKMNPPTWEIIQIWVRKQSCKYRTRTFISTRRRRKKTHSQKSGRSESWFIYFSELGASETNTIRFMADSKIINNNLTPMKANTRGVCVRERERERERVRTVVLYDLFTGTKGCPVIDILKNRNFK